MKKSIKLILCSLLIVLLNDACYAREASFAHDYIQLLEKQPTSIADNEWQSLFSTSAKKIVNSKLICHNRSQLKSQMIEVEQKYGIKKVELLKIYETKDDSIKIIHFEITFGDNSSETVIAIVKANNFNQIEEINEVFGVKNEYDWNLLNQN